MISSRQESGVEPEGYAEFIADLKDRVRSAQFSASRAVNTELLRLDWSVGRDILDRQNDAGWGGKAVARIAADMKRDFPRERGWSRSSLLHMRRAADVWPTEAEFVQQVAGRLPWTFAQVLIDRLGSREKRDWYAAQAAECGRSRNVLEHQIKVDLRGAIGAAPTNFTAALEAPDSELAQQLVKDPYVFEHQAFSDRLDERDVEQVLTNRMQDTLLEFGRGMSFVGRQVRLAISDESTGETDEFDVDLLFFSTEQLRFVDPAVRHALASSASPVAVADYCGLPDDARTALPSTTELQAVITDKIARIES